jgi:CopG family nickel-responsive transcriptional regulator
MAYMELIIRDYMAIISASIGREMLSEMDDAQRELGFVGRSELLRAGVRLLLAQKREHDDLVGSISCILVVTHEEDSEQPVTNIKHEFDDLVKTHLHYKLGSRKCLELFILEGEGIKLREIARQFQTSKGVDNVKLIRP